MERAWLEARLEEGGSIESIAKEVGKSPSTVAYWAKKHGLRSQHASRHAPRGGVARETLLALVERGLSVRQIGDEIGMGFSSVRHWLAKYGLRTEPLSYTRRDGEKPPSVLRECPRHGWTDYVPSGQRAFYRCPRCAMERVAARRRRIKEILVAEAGGCCRVCGYDIYIGALQFHHQDPGAKRFTVSRGGTTGSLDSMREEARKCVLLCANCHAEVEAGLVLLASPADNPG
jgi:transposase